MDTRRTNLIIGAAGGTAGDGAKTYKLSLPTAWVREMGMDADARELELLFDGSQITVRRVLPIGEYANAKKSLGHDVRMLRYYDADTLCTSICADFTEQTLRADNHTSLLVKTAFGKKEAPTWADLQGFLEERCLPRARAGLREFLEAIGLDEYDPIEIIKKTSGRMAEDRQWLEIEVL